MKPVLHGWPDDPFVHVDLGLEIDMPGRKYSMELAGAYPEMSVDSDRPKDTVGGSPFRWAVVRDQDLGKWKEDPDNARFTPAYPVCGLSMEDAESSEAFWELVSTRDGILCRVLLPGSK